MKIPGRTGKGFTLVEILIVVVMIGILASLVIPRFTGHADRAKAAEAITIMGAIRRAALGYYDEKRDWPTIGSVTTPATAAEIQTQLAITFGSPASGWSFAVEKKTYNSVDDCLITAKLNASDMITLRAAAGDWCGIGNYKPSGKFWPALHPKSTVARNGECDLT
ncbi:MAG TPA: prepilin-type N-terminal cleavage/methylation domain-containing protein [Candidatus Omnitrophota bacterium]|nr:prepilin-type N-terminal cleavage/methylation domain-containing protein [Candidatus Omnitrophota bacterium]HPS36723.1 prepilin-type N-terminal cleavage/methylation domain-containing protein [Candidatus Omnitrophota bacterium]